MPQLSTNVKSIEESGVTILGRILEERNAIMKDLKEKRKPYTKDCKKDFHIITSKLNARKDILEETKKEILRHTHGKI